MTNAEAIDRFRRIALGLPGAAEGSHAGAADFRVNNRIFVTLAYAARNQGTLKLTLEQQADFLAERGDVFAAVHGGWGRMGMTFIRLDTEQDTLVGAITTAYRNVANKPATKKRAPKK